MGIHELKPSVTLSEYILKKRSIFVGLCLLLLLVAMAATAIAQSLPKTYDVYMGGYLIMRLRTGTDELTLPERRQIVQQRVTNLMQCSDTGNINVTVTKKGGGYRIVANNVLITTVSATDARLNKTTTWKQAKSWEKNIRQTFPKAAAACKAP